MRSILPVIFLVFVLAGGIFSSCKKHGTEPPQDTTHKCDTCCDTCHKPPCDTCNIDKDSAAHAFTWTVYNIPSETNLTGVWVYGSNDIFVLGGTLWHFDGAIFADLQPRQNIVSGSISLDGALSGYNIFAVSQTDFWLVSGSDVLHTTNGKYFNDYRKGAVNACWGTKSSDMFFVGNGGHIFHYDGTSFSEMASNTTKDIRSVWGTRNNDVWAGGYSESTGQSVLLHYSGLIWQEINLLPPPLNVYSGSTGHSLDYVWAVDSAGYKIVIPSGSSVWRQTNNGSWRSDSLLLPNHAPDGGFIALSGTQGNSANDFITVGGWGWIGHWNGKTWKKYDELFDYGNPNYGPAGFSFRGNTACAVGTKGGQSWVAVGTRKQ